MLDTLIINGLVLDGSGTPLLRLLLGLQVILFQFIGVTPLLLMLGGK